MYVSQNLIKNLIFFEFYVKSYNNLGQLQSPSSNLFGINQQTWWTKFWSNLDTYQSGWAVMWSKMLGNRSYRLGHKLLEKSKSGPRSWVIRCEFGESWFWLIMGITIEVLTNREWFMILDESADDSRWIFYLNEIKFDSKILGKSWY